MIQQNKKDNKYYEQLFAKKLQNLDEMDTFLERHKLTKLTQKEIYNLNSTKKIELVIFKFLVKKSQGPDGFIGANSTKKI